MRSRTKLVVTLLSPLAGLFVVEGLLRVLAFEAAPLPRLEGGLFRISSDPRLTFENRPGAVRRTEYRDAPDAAPRIVEQRVNEQGFRGAVVARAKPLGTYRIACIGDSHTFGTGVAEDETWPVLLERGLNDDGEGARVEVLNCGVSAYDTRREVLLLRARVLAFEPDLVLLQYHVNDVDARNQLGFKAADLDPVLRLTDPELTGWIADARRYSRLFDLTLDSLRRYRAARDETGMSLASYAPSSAGWQRMTASLREARALLAAKDIAFGVVLYPFLLEHEGFLSSHAAFERVAAFCRSEDIPYLDTEPDFLAHDVDALRVHRHDDHANGAANLVFARAIERWLARRGLPPHDAPGAPRALEPHGRITREASRSSDRRYAAERRPTDRAAER